jgi:hypothetical protein
MKHLFKKRIPTILLILCNLACSQMLFSQKNIAGEVIDSKGEPLVGVNIRLLGTSIVTLTDLNGKFTLLVPSENAKVQFTLAGYVSVTIDVVNQTAISVVLKEDLININEVVVV